MIVNISVTYRRYTLPLQVQRGEQMLQRVMNSARIKEHPRLTVSTEAGMLHYELQPQTQLLFLAITQVRLSR